MGRCVTESIQEYFRCMDIDAEKFKSLPDAIEIHDREKDVHLFLYNAEKEKDARHSWRCGPQTPGRTQNNDLGDVIITQVRSV